MQQNCLGESPERSAAAWPITSSPTVLFFQRLSLESKTENRRRPLLELGTRNAMSVADLGSKEIRALSCQQPDGRLGSVGHGLD